ncbi:MAG: cobalamin-dependent protein, partial [Clostridia bacterium]|nr:cobalamin-dependent protein [Clostridia bacterium]
MDRKKLYLVQINVTYSKSIAYLPYAAGCIAAYAMSDAQVHSKYDLAEILCIRHTLEESFAKFENPSVVGFSCYVWNMEYNLRLAEMIKKKYPDCLIVFGGHNVPEDTSLLEKHGFIDVLIHSEGEEPFANLLKAYDGDGDFSAIPDISFRKGGGFVTTEKKRIYDITNYPSPYAAKIFDRVIEKYPDITFHATLETNRGCPYGCAFCDWC